MQTYKIREIFIKNMICTRCMKVIKQDLNALGVEVLEMRLGKLKVRYPEGEVTLNQIEEILKEDEFEFIKDKNEQISESIKLMLIQMVNNLPIARIKNLSDHLAENLHRDYWTLSKLFSKTEEITIEKYFILLRVEKAKELIEYNELNFSEMAFELGYNSIHHLSRQFKQVTGMSMSDYKRLNNKPRLPFDKII